MRKIKIVADSSADLLALEEVDFAHTPMKIITDRREFVDDASIDADEMTDFLAEYKGKSQTSCPNPSDWLEAFDGADDVICVTITSALSGSYNSACTAKKIYESENTDKRVFVLDTLSAGPEITMAVRKLGEYVRDGREFEDICRDIKEYIKNTGLVFMLKSLKNFANNGRVSPIVAKLVGIAGICIVGKASDEGTLEPLHKIRGEKRTLEALFEEMKKFGFRSGKVSIGHCQNEQAALTLKEKIMAEFKHARVEIHKMRGLCSFYAEKGGMLVGFEKAIEA